MGSKEPSIKRNLVYNLSYQILLLIVPLITTPYVSRVLGPDGLGTYSITTAIAKYFSIFAMLGMANYGNRTIATHKNNEEQLAITFWNLVYFQSIAAILMTLLYVLYTAYFGYSKYGTSVISQMPLIVSCVFDVSWLFFGLEQFRMLAVKNTFIKIFTALLVFLFVRERDDVWVYCFINAASALAGQLLFWPYILKRIKWKKPQWDRIISHLKPNCVLMVSVIAVSIYTQMDKIMIGRMSDISQAGYYENTEKILTIANTAAGAIGAVMLPRITSLNAEGENNKIAEYIGKSMKYIMIFAIAIAFGIAGVSTSFSTVYFGEAFRSCDVLLCCIAPAIICYAWSNIIRNQYLLPNNIDSVFVVATIMAALVNLLLNSILIPLFGALGAVIGTVGAQVTELIYQSSRVRKNLPLKQYAMGNLPYLLFGFLMFVLCKLIEHLLGISTITLFLEIIFGAVFFLACSVAYMFYTKDEVLTEYVATIKRKIL